MTARRSRHPNISGSVEPGFERVREAFAGNFSDGPEVGAAFAAYVDGRKVVDLWGGEARPGVPWRDDTLGVLWSATKGVTALCVQVLADRRQLDLDVPVAGYWPEFAAAGKEAVTTRHVLTHTAGLPTWDGYRELVTLADPAGWGRTEAIAAALAAAPPLWAPGRRLGYHAFTFGWLLGEIVRRITGDPLGAWFRANVAAPLGLDLWIGLPAEHHHRVADLLPALPADPALALLIAATTRPDALTGRALLVDEHGGVDRAASVANDARFRAAEIPAGGGIGDARSLARLYGALAAGGAIDGVRLVSEGSVLAHTTEHVAGLDEVLLVPMRYALGYWRPSPPAAVFGPNDEAFGHNGMGGVLGFADPAAGVGFGYVMNQMLPGIAADPRAGALTAALYESL